MQLAWLIPSMLVGSYLGATTGSWQMFFMSAATSVGLVVARRISESRQLEPGTAVIFAADSVWVGDYQLPKYEIYWKREWHDLVYRAYLDLKSEPSFKLPFDFTSGHALIIGPTGSGKSELLKCLLGNYFQQPALELALFDFKGGATFGGLANHHSGKVKLLVTDIDGQDHAQCWKQLESELYRREVKLAQYGCSRIEDYRATDLPRLIVVVDELANALAESSTAQAAITAIAARGRSLGVHLIAASQSVQGITRATLVNLKSRVLLGEADAIDMAQLNIRKPANRPNSKPGWLVGLAQNAESNSNYFFYPVGAILGY